MPVLKDAETAEEGRPASRRGPRPIYPPTPVAHLMKMLHMDDVAFAAFVGNVPRNVQNWRLGAKSPVTADLVLMTRLASERLGYPVTVNDLYDAVAPS
jgi:DNA-binding transcriptional regulator YiaG